MNHPMIQPAADSIMSRPGIESSRAVAGLLTGFGLDLLAELLSGPTVDRATLQLVGVLSSSILLPGLAGALVTQQTPNIGKGS
eukprot:2488587-Amphidinium_carterae.1